MKFDEVIRIMHASVHACTRAGNVPRLCTDEFSFLLRPEHNMELLYASLFVLLSATVGIAGLLLIGYVRAKRKHGRH